MLRLIAVLEEFFVYTSVGQKVVDINVAAGIALHELRTLKGFYEESGPGVGQEVGSSTNGAIKPV